MLTRTGRVGEGGAGCAVAVCAGGVRHALHTAWPAFDPADKSRSQSLLFDCISDVLTNADKAQLGPKVDVAAAAKNTFPTKMFARIVFQALETWLDHRQARSEDDDDDEDEDSEDADGSDSAGSSSIKEVRLCRWARNARQQPSGDWMALSLAACFVRRLRYTSR